MFQNFAPNQLRRFRSFRFNANVLNLTDEQLHARYRFGRELINFVLDLIKEDLSRKTKRNHALRPIYQLLIALLFYASGGFLQVNGDTIGLEKSTVSRVVHNVSGLLAAKQAQFIKWPTDVAEKNETKNGFYRRRTFPGVIGCIDGTHKRNIVPCNN